MIWCLSCSEEVAPVAAMNGAAQIVQSCPKCGEPIGNALSAPTAGFDKDQQVRKVGPPPRPLGGEVVSISTAKRAQAAESLIAPGDIIGQVRARLVYLDAEIAKRSGLEVEAKKLRKMLSAAERMERTES